MKSNWQTKKLDEVCEVEYGTRVVNKRDGGSKYSVYGGGGATFFMDEYNREDRMVIGRFAMSERCTRFVKVKFFLNDSGLTISPKSKEISQNFLDYQTLYLNDVFYSLAKGSAQKNLDVPAFRNLEISYPESLVEQKRIVKILDDVFGGIEKAKENAEKNLKNSQELFESYLQNLSGEKSALGALVDIKTGKLNANAMKENGQYPFFTCAREIYAIDSYSFDCEAILLAGNNAVGDFNVKHYNGKFDAYQRTYVITVNKENKILYRYLYYQLLKSLKEFKGKSVGAGTKFLKIGMIQDLQITLPSLGEQKEIVKKLDALSGETKKLEAIFRRKIADLDELKKSVLEQAFAGEL